METAITNLISALQQQIEKELRRQNKDSQIIEAILNAYNAYQEMERDGVDYIFNIYDQKDLETCVKGGMSAATIVYLYNRAPMHTPLFYFGVNHAGDIIESHEELYGQLSSYAEEIAHHTILYHDNGAFRELYKLLVQSYMIDKDI